MRIAKRVARLRSKSRIAAYDNALEVLPMDGKFRNMVYGLSYSAQDRYRGAEIMFLADQLTIPDTVAPMHLAA